MPLPEEFWLSKSPCEYCAKELIAAYEHLERKPTIHTHVLYEAKPSPVVMLMGKGFTFHQWDLSYGITDDDKRRQYQDEYIRRESILEELESVSVKLSRTYRCSRAT